MVFMGAVLSLIVIIFYVILGSVFIPAMIVGIVMTVKHHKKPAIIMYVLAGIALALAIALTIYLCV